MEPVSDAKQRLLHADPAVSGEDAQTIDLRGVERATGSRNGVFGRVFGIFGIFFETNVGRAVARVRAHGDESDERKRAVRGVDISRSGVDISHSGVVDISHSVAFSARFFSARSFSVRAVLLGFDARLVTHAVRFRGLPHVVMVGVPARDPSTGNARN